MQVAERERTVFSRAVPGGDGKTLASMAVAMNPHIILDNDGIQSYLRAR
jgi:hypothetical protein